MKLFKKHAKGFTLIELLIVIALIAILAGAIIVALNPARQFALARNSERASHLNAILNLISQNTVENHGTFSCGGVPIPTVTSTMTSVAAADNYDICNCLIPTYTNALPFDPNRDNAHYASCTDYDTGYLIIRNASSSRITLMAPGAELSQTITYTQ